MDGPRFDAWTRRRVGLLAGGLTASLLRLPAADLVGARRRKRKKKAACRPLRFTCKDKKRRQRCCPGLFCAEVEGLSGDRCCQPYRTPCRDDSECCGVAECEVINGLDGDRCCGDEGGPCGSKLDCCGDLSCDTVKSSSETQCCLDVQERCEVFDQASVCCRNLNCDAVDGLQGLRCCGLPGVSCAVKEDCCEDLVCTDDVCQVPPPEEP
jgi:hypothetical protein